MKYRQMKVFITCAEEYEQHRTENGKSILLQQLQFLGATLDMSVFDPGSPVTSQFYMRLYELMKTLESHNNLTWAAVGCLKQACHNAAARDALTHTYKFNQILARFLSPLTSHEKLMQLLHLLEDLSYGIKFNWQEAHLPTMMKSLAALITGENEEYIRPSITVMINLCYKNLPAIYTLMRTVDQTQFLASIKELGQHDTHTHVQVFKLLFTLDYVTGEMHEEDVLRFVSETFITLGDAFSMGNVVLMRQIVDFFKDMRTNEHTKEQVLSYDRFLQDTHNLLGVLDGNSADPLCVGVLFEFVHSLVALRVSNLGELYPHIVQIALGYIHTKVASCSALLLIQEVVADESVDDDIKTKVVTSLDGRLEIILLSLDNEGDADNRARLSALMTLLKTACKNEVIRSRILTIVNSEVAHNLFSPLLNRNTHSEQENIFDVNYSKFYVYMLDFVSVLTTNSEFKCLYTMLLTQKKVHMILALALYLGTEDIKRRVLNMTRAEAFPEACLKSLATTLCELESLLIQHSGARPKKCTESKTHESAPLFGPSQEIRLNELIKQTNDVVVRAKNEDNVVTSYLMKLYEYKLAAVSHNERQLEAHLEAATSHSTHLQHQLAQVSAEASRLQREIYHNRKYLEEAITDREESDAKLIEAKAALEAAEESAAESITSNENEIKDLRLTVEEMGYAIDIKTSQLSVAIDEAQNKGQELVELRATYQQQMQTMSELSKAVADLQQRVEEQEKHIDERDEETRLINNECVKEHSENMRLEQLLIQSEMKLEMVQSQLDAKKRQLGELERIRNVIFEISTPTEKKTLLNN